MRLLMFHVDSFTCVVTEKGRSPIVETPAAPSEHIDEGLLVLACAEAGDELATEEIAAETALEVQRLAQQLGAREVMLLPFAHLFAELAPPRPALEILDAACVALRDAGMEVHRPPFGWFHTWDLQAKGHPLSRVARRVTGGRVAPTGGLAGEG